ncbi:MAG: hypothetical protein KAG56_11130 [Sulfurovaceae bacterium]|nr:hypothetical protein [Sulfurovaceae bacterium]
MKKYLILWILLMVSHVQLVADTIYDELGISVPKKTLSIKVVKEKIEEIKPCKLKKKYKTSLSTLAKHLTSQKVSKDKTHYGVEVAYKVSKKMQLSIDILAELDIKKPSKMMKDNQANIRLAISL